MSMRALLALVLFALSLIGCSETPVSLPLRSLERSGEVSFLCADENGQGYDINACPDFDSVENRRHMFAMVTQTLRGEVAIIDLSEGRVVDLDRSTPGFTFLPVGANPVDIVTTPGGIASFVSVAEPGKEGIFSIPTSCARPPVRDLTSWSACALPAAPGEMAILIDAPEADNDGDPTTPAPVRASCDVAATVEAATPGTALAATREACPADLALETAPAGRRKLMVMLPTMGMYAIIDAQSILDREPGTYQPCAVERYIELKPDVPAGPIKQKVPPDLEGVSCPPPELNYGPPPGTYVTQPGGIDVTDGQLRVADRGVPIIHHHDITDPCAPVRQPPLLPFSFEAPNRVVTTSQVAVSPPTSKGQRFAYAIDEWDGSVMIFEVTPGHADRLPIVRPGSARLPFEAPDRVAYASPARDVGFALRDAPAADSETGIATIGTYCNPDPAIDPASPAAKYRPATDYSKGAGPRNLRGVFGFVLLASGQIAVVDLEDFDAPCRRPITTNSAVVEDFRGCFADPADPDFYTLDATLEGKPTVSRELSCRVFEPHRSRSGHFLINAPEFGVNAPALKSFPRLRSPEGGNLPTGQTEDALQHPKVLAVDFVNPSGGTTPAELYVGTTLYTAPSNADATPENELPTDPAVADRLSVALSFAEPRSYGGDEEMTLEYEGAFVDERPAGFAELSTDPATPDALRDLDASFCNRGVQDVALTKEMGVSDLAIPASQLDAFARRHADYVQVTQELRGKDGPYWSEEGGQTCGGQSGKAAYFACRDAFGTAEAPASLRDFRILEAYQGRLVIEPREYADEADKERIMELFDCCFVRSGAVRYKVRAGYQWVLTGSGSGFRHNVIASSDPDPAKNLRCIRDCNPRRARLKSRAFEVSAKDCTALPDGAQQCPIGPARPEDIACVLDESEPLVPGDRCVFEGLTHRFAIYRGNAEEGSTRDTAFVWTVTGGFSPLTANLAAQSRAVSPQSMVLVPQIGQLAVADGASEGLVLVSLDSVAVSRLFF